MLGSRVCAARVCACPRRRFSPVSSRYPAKYYNIARARNTVVVIVIVVPVVVIVVVVFANIFNTIGQLILLTRRSLFMGKG